MKCHYSLSVIVLPPGNQQPVALHHAASLRGQGLSGDPVLRKQESHLVWTRT